MSARRILLIDDDDDIQEVVQLSLEITRNWRVLTASFGAQGLATAELEQPDAIFLDIMMPDMDGPTTLQRLKTSPRTQHIPVVLLTAQNQAIQERFTDLEVAAVITKPFEPLGLANKLAELLGW